jgi:hypothetical protein
MNEVNYRKAVEQLMNPKLTFNEKLGNWASGLCGESAELDELADEATFDELCRTKFDKLIDESSDCRWYATAFTITLDVPEWWTVDGPNTPIPHSPQQHTRYMMRIAGKINDVVKKVIYHGHEFDNNRRAEILGLLADYMRYYQSFLWHISISDEQVKQYNVNKLAKRYKNLKFTTEQSVNRNNE